MTLSSALRRLRTLETMPSVMLMFSPPVCRSGLLASACCFQIFVMETPLTTLVTERAAHRKAAHANSVIEMANIFAEAQRLHVRPEIGNLLHKLQQREVAISSGAQCAQWHKMARRIWSLPVPVSLQSQFPAPGP